MKKSVLVLVAVGIAMLSAPLAFAADPIELTDLVFETPVLTADFWDASIVRVEKKLPNIAIKKLVCPTGDRNSYAKQLLATDQFPDVLHSLNPAEFVEADVLTPFDDAWVREHFMVPYGSALNGKVYTPPTGSQVIPMIYYNKAIFQEVGVTPPTTWAELLDVAEKLKQAGHTPFILPGGQPSWGAGIIMHGIVSVDIYGKDPDWLNKRKAGQVSFSDANFVTAIKKWQDLVTAGYLEKGALGVDFKSANNAFLAGQGAMYPMGSWFVGYIPQDNPFEVGVFPLPSEDGSVVLPVAVGSATFVSKLTKHPKEAMEYAKAWALDPDNMKALIESDAYFPLIKGRTIEDYHVDVSDLFLENYAYLSRKDVVFVPSYGFALGDNSDLPGIRDEYARMAQELFMGADVEKELAKLDKVWDKTAKRLKH